jgi:phosphoribosyl-AMP cyclohydrolase
MTLVGGVATIIVLAATAGRRPERALLSRAALWVTLLLVLPSWIVMRIAAQWTASKEGIEDLDATWLGIGYMVGDAGLVVLLVTTGFTFWWSRRRGEGWQRGAVLGLAALYLAALAVAWFAMSGKPGG